MEEKTLTHPISVDTIGDITPGVFCTGEHFLLRTQAVECR